MQEKKKTKNPTWIHASLLVPLAALEYEQWEQKTDPEVRSQFISQITLQLLIYNGLVGLMKPSFQWEFNMEINFSK